MIDFVAGSVEELNVSRHVDNLVGCPIHIIWLLVYVNTTLQCDEWWRVQTCRPDWIICTRKMR